MASDDTEITLGMGKLLGLFFLLAAICGVFFSIGYSLGKSTGREQALNDLPANTAVESTASTSGDDKPSATIAMKSSGEPAAEAQAANAKTSADLTFYKAVKQSDAATHLSGNQTVDTTADAEKPLLKENAAVKKKDVIASNDAGTKVPSEMKRATPVTGPGTFVVQIAALSREDDAVALAGALRKKSYNVFVVNNPITNDKLYHVQVGPFASLLEADAMKLKLTGEGYNPIVKR
jgi:DedD protein